MPHFWGLLLPTAVEFGLSSLTFDLRDPPRVPAAFKGRRQKGAQRINCGLYTDRASTETSNIRIVVRACESRLGTTMENAGAYARMTIGGDRHADARATHEDAERACPTSKVAAHSLGIVWIINGFGCVSSKVMDSVAVGLNARF
jgi:hypothetical protein